MDRVGHVLKSAVKILYWKCRYGGRFQAAPVQGFDRLYLELAPKAQISLAERIQNRGMLYLSADRAAGCGSAPMFFLIRTAACPVWERHA